MTTIGIIGAGEVGSQIARAAIGNGYTVVIANSRGPKTLKGLIADLDRPRTPPVPKMLRPPGTSQSSQCPSKSSTTCPSKSWPARSCSTRTTTWSGATATSP